LVIWNTLPAPKCGYLKQQMRLACIRTIISFKNFVAD